MTDTWVDEKPKAGATPLAKAWETRCKGLHAAKVEYERLLDEWKGPQCKGPRNKVVGERLDDLLREQIKLTKNWADAVEKHYGPGYVLDWIPCKMEGGLWEFHCSVNGDYYQNPKQERAKERV